MDVDVSPQPISKVFISYTQESELHSARVLKLSNSLREQGFDSDIDQYHSNQRWPSWMENRIEWADFVLMVCTKTYLQRWKGGEKEGVGLGAQWESLLTRQHLYVSPQKNDKFIPVFFDVADRRYIPTPLADVTHVHLGLELENLCQLRSRLLGIPPAQMPPIRTSLASVAVAEDFFQPANITTQSCFDPTQIGLRDEAECISSNLFPVQYPQTIFSAKLHSHQLSHRKNHAELMQKLRESWVRHGNSGKVPSDYLLENGVVYTFRSFGESFWKALFEDKTLIAPSQFQATDWAGSSIASHKHNFIKLLNSCLHHLCENNGTAYEIVHSDDLKCYLFAATSGSTEGKIKVFALKQKGERTIYKMRSYAKDGSYDSIQHWQHEAFKHNFVRFGNTWFLVLTPFWAFTSDGICRRSRFHEKSSSNMRKPERNRSVLGHVLLWASVLCQGSSLFDQNDGFRIGRPIELSSAPSIQDSDWVSVAQSDEQGEMQTEMELPLWSSSIK